MSEIPTWLTLTLASVVPLIAFIGFWMTLSSRLTKAELLAEDSSKEAEKTAHKLASLCTEFSDYRERIAREYIHRETMTAVEDRIALAINRFGDRLDRIFERQKNDQ